jgi:hypothetical protein
MFKVREEGVKFKVQVERELRTKTQILNIKITSQGL